MWEYTDKVREYYRNPKNVGAIEDADAIAEVGSISCGDALKIFLKIDANGIITDAKFQTFGCGSAVASASALTEMIIGKTVEEAEKLTNQDIADFLGGLPEQKMHCSVLGQEALEAAIANYKGIPVNKGQERIVCKCFGTTEAKLRQVIRENNLQDIEGITNYCKAGGGCGKCKHDIQDILFEEISFRSCETEKKPTLTKTQMILKVNNVLENYVAAELRKDGGDIELVDIEGLKVIVNLKGSCKHCPSSNLTLKNFVENTLKEHLGPEIEVVEA